MRGLDPKDPIQVGYEHPVGDEPTGRAHPELLKMHPSHGHDMTIVNGISRIGWMSGGRAARWVDDEMADVLTAKATEFTERDAPDSLDLLGALLGTSPTGREELVEQAGALSLITPRWKLIAPHEGRKVSPETNTELGNDPLPQLYDLSTDLGERRNVAGEHPDLVRELSGRLERIRRDGRSRR